MARSKPPNLPGFLDGEAREALASLVSAYVDYVVASRKSLFANQEPVKLYAGRVSQLIEHGRITDHCKQVLTVSLGKIEEKMGWRDK